MKISKIIFIFITVFLFVPDIFFAQPNVNIIEFSGKVSDGMKGIGGVAVTDGTHVTQTNPKGEYKLMSNASVDFVYITIPSGYEIPMDNGLPYFFHRVGDKTKGKQKIDFTLTKSSMDDNKHITIVCADPQVAFLEELPLLEEATRDIKNLVSQTYSNLPVNGIICGDIVSDIEHGEVPFSAVKQLFTDTDVPFFYLAGNHDMDNSGRSNHNSKKTFEEFFGPAYYSYNKGKVHYVVLDDVFFTGRGYSYIGYVDEKQLNWLEQDLSFVPEGATVVIALHIPTYSREARKGKPEEEGWNKVMMNRRKLYQMLENYNVHIMSAHEHYNENYIISNKIYEHVHAALCGIFWQTPYNSDGTPLGYAVYEFDGDNVEWYYKAIGINKDIQFDAYTAGADKNKPDAIIANVWNYDPDWKVFWYENGKKMGEMEQYTGWDPRTVKYVEDNRENFRYKYVGAGKTEHLFFAEPTNKEATIKIEVVDRFNNIYSKVPSEVDVTTPPLIEGRVKF